MANLVQIRMLEDISGILLIDKPAGITFTTVIKNIKRKFNLAKLGHGGSLETMASGLMVLLVGDANGFVDHITNLDREYAGTVRFGVKTNTGDINGQIVEGASETLPDISEFKGDVFLTEPRFAAIRKEGASHYEIVDTGHHKPVLSHVYKMEFNGNSFVMHVSKNFIARALVSDMNLALESLRRTKVGKFSVENAITFEKILDTDLSDVASCVIPIRDALR